VKHGGSKRVFLTFVGDGAFGNRKSWVANAINHAISACRNLDLEVYIVHFRSIDPFYRHIGAKLNRSSNLLLSSDLDKDEDDEEEIEGHDNDDDEEDDEGSFKDEEVSSDNYSSGSHEKSYSQAGTSNKKEKQSGHEITEALSDKAEQTDGDQHKDGKDCSDGSNDSESNGRREDDRELRNDDRRKGSKEANETNEGRQGSPEVDVASKVSKRRTALGGNLNKAKEDHPTSSKSSAQVRKATAVTGKKKRKTNKIDEKNYKNKKQKNTAKNESNNKKRQSSLLNYFSKGSKRPH